MSDDSKALPQKRQKLFGKDKMIAELRSIFVIFFVIFACRSVLFEPFRIPSGSMIPTLMIGDFVLVNKFSYGFKVPFSDMYSDPIYLFRRAGPKRGDIIVFKFPDDENVHYIKRVVGAPGDRIQIIDKVLYVNGEPAFQNELSAKKSKKIHRGLEKKFQPYDLRFFDTQTGGVKHKMIIREDGYYADNLDPIVVPEDKYFVMGDNRDFSSDSRAWGWVDHRLIKGRAFLVWFSLNPPDSGMGHEFKFRPWRIGTIIR